MNRSSRRRQTAWPAAAFSSEEIRQVMRDMGENVTEADIEKVLGAIDSNGVSPQGLEP